MNYIDAFVSGIGIRGLPPWKYLAGQNSETGHTHHIAFLWLIQSAQLGRRLETEGEETKCGRSLGRKSLKKAED